NLQVGLNGQFSDFARVGGNFEWQATPELHVNGEIYGAYEANGENVLGGYLLANYTVTDYLRVHSQIDVRHSDRLGDTDTIWTNGILLRPGNDHLWIIADYEYHAESQGSGFFVTLVARF